MINGHKGRADHAGCTDTRMTSEAAVNRLNGLVGQYAIGDRLRRASDPRSDRQGHRTLAVLHRYYTVPDPVYGRPTSPDIFSPRFIKYFNISVLL